ncbi:cyclic nucleotide-gated ion channel 1-like [Eucalyptus grandis]|uniref:cyclic nucleotide-gated ion channel 1-like n=1 Tax=Eucalyptus grandis TaxID=71139 RepID=UPI00192EA7AC|nr:cyclic nucleotide-gated ion channel 1-like [Eucalyptus grandis]XP_039155285.1 cyclic nucleotide-gated ion channel 1-like [Eucalyptus grandis]XP_039155286.1 cyclic nucleotide-gated ion channel 1-like [Eucalyptus grandis]
MDIREDTRDFAKIKSLRMPLSSLLVSVRKILDPQSPCLQQWNRIFLISCVFALALDPLFFYIPVIDVNKRCLDIDNRMKIIASLLRTIIDAFYIIHVIIKFHTQYTIPPSRRFGREVLINYPSAVSRRYFLLYFFLDILAILPIPQVVVFVIIPTPHRPGALMIKESLKFIIYGQCVPRIIRIYPLYKAVTRTSGLLLEKAWAGAAFNLLLFMFASHVFGTFWYLFSIDRKVRCWEAVCLRPDCDSSYLYCSTAQKQNYTFLDTACPLIEPNDIKDSKEFSFGIFIDALRSGMVESKDLSKKLFYCSWWGFRNLSSLGQNLQTSTSVGEIVFAFSIAIAGLVLYSLLINNVQKNLQSTKVRRAEERRARRQDAEQDVEQWMLRRMLPEGLKARIRRYERYRWQETRGVDEESLIRNLPKDLRGDIKRHICLDLLLRVPMFEIMDEQLLDAMCDRLKPVLYAEKSTIVREGDPVDEMLFIIGGKLVTMTTNGGRTGFFNSVYLKPGDFCGEELLTWALDPNSSSNLPNSTETVEAITEVEAFALTTYDLKFVASQVRRLHGRHHQHIFRFYSRQWRTWAACFIQAAWHRHCKRKRDKALRDAEDRSHNALAKDGGASPSLAATICASRFAAKALRNLRKSGSIKMPRRLPPLMPQKPAEPDFTTDGSK